MINNNDENSKDLFNNEEEKTLYKSNKINDIKDKDSFSQSNLEELLNISKMKTNDLLIDKSLFITDYPISIRNISYIKQDNIGNRYGPLFKYNSHFNSFQYPLNNHEPIREAPPKNEELKERKEYYINRKIDNFYQFNKYIKIGTTHICHPQVRKNILQNNQFIIYNKKYSLEVFDIIKNKMQSLIQFDENQSEGIICFDVFFSEDKIFACLGKTDGNCDIFLIKESDFKECLKIKNFNQIPKFQKILSLLTAEKNNNFYKKDYDEEIDTFINYVKFLSKDKLISTSNDCYFKITDLAKEKVINTYKNNTPINHCDINIDKNILLCIGDSKFIDIVDLKQNKQIEKLGEHYDFGIVIKFNPYDNNYFASGNQDFGCKIWDIRNLGKGSINSSWGDYDGTGDLDWINERSLCFMENIFLSHIFDIKDNTIQNLCYFGYGNGVVHDRLNDKIYINIVEGDQGGILCYEPLSNKVINSYNNFLL